MSEYLGADVGHPDTEVIKQIWELADASDAGPNYSSLQATARAAADQGVPFREAFAAFGAVNAVPSSFYEEGADYRDAAITRSLLVTPTRPNVGGKATLDHLTSAYFRLRPGRAISPGSQLTVTLRVPSEERGPEATLVDHPTVGRGIARALRPAAIAHAVGGLRGFGDER